MTALLLSDRGVRRWRLSSEERARHILSASGLEDTTRTVVYALTDSVGNARYVGCCTSGLGYRIVRHVYFAESGKHWRVSEWLREQDYDVRALILEYDPPNRREAEFAWLRRLREAGADLLNHTGMPPSASHRAGISAANRRRWDAWRAERGGVAL